MGSGDSHTLFLTAGKLLGISGGAVGQPDAAQEPHRPIVGLDLAEFQHAAGRLHHVLQSREVWKELEVLEDHAQEPPYLACAGQA